mgnify:CR=1 FL=1
MDKRVLRERMRKKATADKTSSDVKKRRVYCCNNSRICLCDTRNHSSGH